MCQQCPRLVHPPPATFMRQLSALSQRPTPAAAASCGWCLLLSRARAFVPSAQLHSWTARPIQIFHSFVEASTPPPYGPNKCMAPACPGWRRPRVHAPTSLQHPASTAHACTRSPRAAAGVPHTLPRTQQVAHSQGRPPHDRPTCARSTVGGAGQLCVAHTHLTAACPRPRLRTRTQGRSAPPRVHAAVWRPLYPTSSLLRGAASL